MNEATLTDKEILTAELVAEAAGFDVDEHVASVAESKATAAKAGKELEINPFEGINEAKAEGHSHVIFNLTHVGRGYAVLTIPTSFHFPDFVVHYASSVKAAKRWIRDNVPASKDWQGIHVFDFI